MLIPTFLVAETGLLTWLLEQAPVVVILGVVIWWLQKKYTKAIDDKDSLAKEVIKLTTLWEEKSDKLEERSEKMGDKNEKFSELVLELLRDIKALVTK
jgi:hypothetical protein